MRKLCEIPRCSHGSIKFSNGLSDCGRFECARNDSAAWRAAVCDCNGSHAHRLELAEAKALSTSAPDHRRFFLHAPEAHIITQHPAALQLRTLQTMAEIATEKNSTIISPAQFMTTVQEAIAMLNKDLSLQLVVEAVPPACPWPERSSNLATRGLRTGDPEISGSSLILGFEI